MNIKKYSMKFRYFSYIMFLSLGISNCISYNHFGRPYPVHILPVDLFEYENKKFTYEDQKRLEAVYKFAPVIRHGAKPCWWKAHKKDEASRYNFITKFDYDKDKRCNNNKNNLMKKLENGNYYDLEATVYFSIIETETHRFITYHFYHAVDRSTYFPNLLWCLNLSHENDGENIQAVIRKSDPDDYIEFLAVESHNNTKISTAEYFDDLPVKIGKKINKKVQLVKYNKFNPICERLDNKRVDFSWKENIGKYSHPAIFVKSGKHSVTIDNSGKDRGNDIFFYPPLSPNSKNRYPTIWKNKDCKRYEYVLKPIRKTLWSMYIHNRHLGNDGVMDGYFRFPGEERGVIYEKIPRHYSGNYIACVFLGFKSNAGILPFAFDLPGKLIKKGRLFFDPASNYRKYLKIDSKISNWSEKYTYNPYLPKAIW